MSAMWWTDVGAALAPWLARVTVGGLVISLLALVAGAFVPRGSAATRVAVRRAGVVVLLLLPIVSFVTPWRWTLPVSSAWLGEGGSTKEIASAGAPAAGTFESAAAIPGATVPADLSRLAAGSAPLSSTEAAAPVLAGPLVFVWALIAGGILAYFGAGLAALRVHARRARDVTAEVAYLLPPECRARVLRGGPFAVPGCWGVARPSVLLPGSSKLWSRDRLRTVLLHETAHLERRDPLFLLLTRAACALHWPNPLAWQLQRTLLRDGEAVCDADVLRRGVPAREYARVLVELAAEARAGRSGLALTISRPGGLARRVTDVLEAANGRPARRGFAAAASALLVTAALACATAGNGPRPADTGEETASTAAATVPGPVAGREVTERVGTWDARDDGGQELYIQLLDGAGGGLSANHVALNDLHGFGRALLQTGGEAVFELVRPAGSVLFEGRFDGGSGRGTYRFVPRRDFTEALGTRGIEPLSPARLLLLAVQDVDLAFVDDLVRHTAGPLDGDLLVRAAIFGVDLDFIREMAAVGYRRLGVQDLVRLKIFEIDPTDVERLSVEEERLTVDEMVSRRIHEKKTTRGKRVERQAAVSRRVNRQATNEVARTHTAIPAPNPE
jgi:beta-lactamase regulating signal transducer with metallopeptidase domain